MHILSGEAIRASLDSKDQDSLFIDPLLEQSQIGNVTVDFRLGYDFLVSVLTRKPYVEIAKTAGVRHRGVSSYFQETRRDLGDRFVLYPGQVVLTTTLEYVALPLNVYLDVLSRSSYTRLGLHMNTMVQPGFRGCLPLELFNHGNNAIELIVGSRICQARFLDTGKHHHYLDSTGQRKYYGDVRPIASRADSDPDIERLLAAANTSG